MRPAESKQISTASHEWNSWVCKATISAVIPSVTLQFGQHLGKTNISSYNLYQCRISQRSYTIYIYIYQFIHWHIYNSEFTFKVVTVNASPLVCMRVPYVFAFLLPPLENIPDLVECHSSCSILWSHNGSPRSTTICDQRVAQHETSNNATLFNCKTDETICFASPLQLKNFQWPITQEASRSQECLLDSF